MKISVLTPTYNRAKLLKKLYKSLIENSKYGGEIQWLIMNDGSTDDTKKVIEEWIHEKKIEIQYYEQENRGKMAAINELVPHATGDIIIDCDSDDYFTKDAFETIKKAYKEYEKEKNIYGLCFLKCDKNGKNIGNEFKNKKTTMFDLYFKEGEDGEKAIAFYSKIRKQYQHELEQKERFITEARMYHKMDLKYQIIGINQPIMVCEYQEEGYTKNITQQFKENPYGYYEYFKEILQRDMRGVTLHKRLYVIKHYILFMTLTKNKKAIKRIKGSLNKLLVILLYLPGRIKTKRMFK